MLPDLFDLTGKACLITGGNGGIGLGMAEGLARCGAKITVWGMNPAKNDKALETLKAYGGEVFVERVDVGQEAEVVGGIAAAVAAMGRLDFVVANAGVGGGGGKPFTDTSTEDWRNITTINLDAVFWTMREACRHMKARAEAGDPGGSLAITSSTSAIHGAPRNQAYASSKAAVCGLARSIAVEYARYGVRANAILPGWVRSDMTAGLQAWDTFNEKAIARVPLKRWGEPTDFAGLAVYLASDASKFHTGDSLVLDGGYTVF